MASRRSTAEDQTTNDVNVDLVITWKKPTRGIRGSIVFLEHNDIRIDTPKESKWLPGGVRIEYSVPTAVMHRVRLALEFLGSKIEEPSAKMSIGGKRADAGPSDILFTGGENIVQLQARWRKAK